MSGALSLEPPSPVPSSGAYHPPPTPGSAGPAPLRTSARVNHARGCDSFTFVRRDDGVDRLEALVLERPHPGNYPSQFDAGCFRAYATADGTAGYALERISTQSNAVVLPKHALNGRTLSLDYIASELMIGEPLARNLIRQLLVEGLLAPKLAGQCDTIAFTSIELGSTVTERVKR